MELFDLLILVFHIAVCVSAWLLASSKHRSPVMWCLICLCTGLIGLLILALLPDGNLELEMARLKTRVRQLENPNQVFPSLENLSHSKSPSLSGDVKLQCPPADNATDQPKKLVFGSKHS